MNERAGLLVRLLEERFDLQLGEQAARDTISDHVDRVAEAMRIGRQAAKVYVTEDAVSKIADQIGHEVRRLLSEEGRHLRVVPGSD
jgi:hypothetical protein